MPVKTCVFDAYGTLFDVAAAAREAAAEPGRESFADHRHYVCVEVEGIEIFHISYHV